MSTSDATLTTHILPTLFSSPASPGPSSPQLKRKERSSSVDNSTGRSPNAKRQRVSPGNTIAMAGPSTALTLTVTSLGQTIPLNNRTPLPNSREEGRARRAQPAQQPGTGEWSGDPAASRLDALATAAAVLLAACPLTPPKPTTPPAAGESPAPVGKSREEVAKTKTNAAHAKRAAILANGQPAPTACTDCIKGSRPCVVWAYRGPVCAHCAGKKLKCEFSEAADAEAIRKDGMAAVAPCEQCVQKGAPQECVQAIEKQRKKFGTACSECQADGKKQFCSINEKPKSRGGKVRRM